MTRKCVNPYNTTHSKKQNKDLRKIQDLAKYQAVCPNIDFNSDQYICTTCRLKIHRQWDNLQTVRSTVRLVQIAQQREDSNQHENLDIPCSPPQIAPTAAPSVLYPQLPSAPTFEQSVTQNVQNVGQGEPMQVEPSPSTSRGIDVRQPPYNPAIPAPAQSFISSIATSDTSNTASNFLTPQGALSEKLNKTLEQFDVTPTRPSDIKKRSVISGKFKRLQTNIRNAIKGTSGVDISPTGLKKKDCVYCRTLFQELAAKLDNDLEKCDKYKILTSIPRRFTVPEVAAATQCSTYMIKVAFQLRNKEGAFSVPPPKRGKPISKDLQKLVIDYYLSDDNSRPSPNARDVVFVKQDDGTKVSKEKRRLLHNLNDLYFAFKEKYKNVNISISKFATLRPRNCCWPGFRGHHITCVCEIHQNFEFLLEALECDINLEAFLRSVVCEKEENRECYLNMCNDCPKLNVVENLLLQCPDQQPISYKQWTHTDQTDIQIITVEVCQFKQLFNEFLRKILEHHFVTCQQKVFIQSLKDRRVRETPAIVIQVDFAQNYSFIVQNAVQGYHWSNRQATIHPFVVHYWKPEDKEVAYKTFCVISDEMNHDADTFHVFRTSMFPHLRSELQEIPFNMIYYVSDGAASQYKNYKNFANLLLHHEDFAINAEWHFTATSHGKSTCDAVSAIVKCSARRESLVRGSYITTPDRLFQFCEQKLQSETLKFVYVSSQDVAAHRPILQERYTNFRKIRGTRKHHMFQPLDGNRFRMARTSDSTVFTEVNFRTEEVTEYHSENVKIGSFYAYAEGNNYHCGLLVEVDFDEGDLRFQTLNLNRRNRSATWPDPLIFTDIPYRDILNDINDPITDDGVNHKITLDDMATIRRNYSLYKSNLMQ